jgi:glycerate kinase
MNLLFKKTIVHLSSFHLMKILIAADSFKDALDSFGVCSAIAKGIHKINTGIEITIFPLADGGEGTSDVLMHHLGGYKRELVVNDPLMRPIKTHYVLSQDGETAFIELAKASGLQLLAENERNPMLTSTHGLGEMIADGIKEGVTNVVLAIGGSATNDAGMGMAGALGFSFYDTDGQLLSGKGKDLINVDHMDVDEEVKQSLSKIKFTTICDVNNPLYGSFGAAYTYAAQKGAKAAEIILLDEGLAQFAKVMNGDALAHIEGAGAAGGCGFGSMLFLNATLRKGIQLIMEMTHFEDQVRKCDIVITGEGQLDGQTAHGKLIQGVSAIAAKYNKPVIALCGTVMASPEEIKSLGLHAAFPVSHGLPLEQALKDTAKNLEIFASKLVSIIKEI